MIRTVLTFCFSICVLLSKAQSWQLTPSSPVGALSDVQSWDDQLYVSTYDGSLYRSSNEGQSWDSLSLPAPKRPIYGLFRSRNRWFASAPGGFFTTPNQGQTWQWIGMPTAFVPTGFAVLGNNHWVVSTADLANGGGAASGILRSTNFGQSWESVTANLPGTSISKMIHSSNDQLVVALDQVNQTAGLFSTWLGPAGSFQWMPLPIRLFYQTDSSRADFEASQWFHMQWYNDSTLLLSADGTVREAGSPNGVYVQWMGFRSINTGSSEAFWVETLPFRPTFNSWWDQSAPANLLLHSTTAHWYGSLQGGSARGGAWIRPNAAQGWSKLNNGIAPGPNGWDYIQFAEEPWGRVFAIHQGQTGVYFNDFSRIWPTSITATKEQSLLIWPNPGNGLLRFKLHDGPAEMHVYNVYGQLVHHQMLEEGDAHELHIGHLKPGTYLLVAKQKEQLVQARYLLQP